MRRVENYTELDFLLARFKNKKTPKRSFIYLLYPHVGTDKDFDTMDKEGWPCRKEIMMDQTMSLIKAVQGTGNKNPEGQFDTRDQLMNKRLDTAGALMGSLFCHIWNKYIEEIKKRNKFKIG